MKKVTVLIALSFVIISGCLIYLVISGISLRTAPLIQPSEISADQKNIARALVHRLFQELQDAHYILWGVRPETEESQRLLKLTAAEYEKTFHQTAHIIQDAESASVERLRACEKPCWLLISEAGANQLESNNFVEKNILPLERSFFTLTIIPFNRHETVAAECERQKRLSLNCLISVSVREVERKMKDPQKHYFFLRKYNESDYFLFIQQAL